MKSCKVSILGTEYTVEFKDAKEDKLLNNLDGYCDRTSRYIAISSKEDTCDLQDFNAYQKKVTRHEIIHAFMFESGLAENFEHKSLGQEETMVDWIAIQYPKMLDVFKQVDCL